jgi:hypothetical protein
VVLDAVESDVLVLKPQSRITWMKSRASIAQQRLRDSGQSPPSQIDEKPVERAGLRCLSRQRHRSETRRRDSAGNALLKQKELINMSRKLRQVPVAKLRQVS